ncbi:MAG: iron-containing alcohol dehydrogenase, partial [Verrucomicrobiae bacterium]|nr:iron-containing alcohol dehydrogenase [Verrucomicrobiae bacterium]
LRRAFRDGADATARKEMALAALFGGIALAHSGLGAVHGFAAAIGGMFSAPHGAVCAALLAPTIRANLAALRAENPSSPTLARYGEIARILTGRSADWLDALAVDLEIPALSAWGVAAEDFAEIARKAAASSSMKGNPVALSADALIGVLKRAG